MFLLSLTTYFLLTTSGCNGAATTSDLFSSMSDMEDLYEHEKLVIEELEKHIQNMDDQIDKVDKFIEKYFSDYNYTIEDAEEYVSHPLNTFSLIKRTYLDWPAVTEKLFGQEAETQLQQLTDLIYKHDIPSSELEGAMGGLYLLLNCYKFNLTEFFDGTIHVPKAQAIERGISAEEGIISDSPLTTFDIKLLGQFAFNSKRMNLSIEILRVALQKAKERKQPDLFRGNSS